jgi:hypothetical protein
MKSKILEVFYCEYCKKHYLRKHLCGKHEKQCGRNPKNWRACHSCIYLAKTKDFIYSGYGETEKVVEILHCNKLNNHVFPTKVEHKGNQFEFAEIENLPMPKQCDHKEADEDQYKDFFNDF